MCLWTTHFNTLDDSCNGTSDTAEIILAFFFFLLFRLISFGIMLIITYCQVIFSSFVLSAECLAMSCRLKSSGILLCFQLPSRKSATLTLSPWWVPCFGETKTSTGEACSPATFSLAVFLIFHEVCPLFCFSKVFRSTAFQSFLHLLFPLLSGDLFKVSKSHRHISNS